MIHIHSRCIEIERLKHFIMAATVIKLFSVLTLHTSLVFAYNLLHCDYHGDCACPEDVLTFVCRVSDGAATTWKGSIFNCPGNRNEILLRHLTFDDGVVKTCNDGAIIGHSIGVSNNSYTSKLNVTVSPEMHNGTVECVQNGPGIHITSVGTCTLILATEPPDAHVLTINSNQFTINWSPPASNCPAMTYDITTTDCGVCPDTTSNAFITCTSLMIDGRICSVVIQTMACEKSSQPDGAANLTIVLRAPSAPNVTARWTNLSNSVLTSISEAEQFFVSDGIDGSATNYTITYSDSTGRICDSVIISASACIDGRCNHTFDIPSVCSIITGLAITVFATSILGDGPSSEPVLLEFNFTCNQSASNETSLNLILGSSIAVTLSTVIVITIMILLWTRFLKNFNYFRNNNPKCITISGETESITIGINSLNLTSLDEDINLKANECYEVTGKSIIYKNTYCENFIDKTLNLDNLLIQIRDQVTPKWYQFGLAVGINIETLDEFSNFPPEECIVEVLDIWLRTNETAVTWRDVADALKEIGFHRLADKILKVYKTGILPAEAAVPMEESSDP